MFEGLEENKQWVRKLVGTKETNYWKILTILLLIILLWEIVI